MCWSIRLRPSDQTKRIRYLMVSFCKWAQEWVLVQELATLSSWLQQVEGWGSSLLQNSSFCIKPASSGMWSLKPVAGCWAWVSMDLVCWVNSQADLLSPGKSSPQGLLWLKVFSVSITKGTSPAMNAGLSHLSLTILNKNLMLTLHSLVGYLLQAVMGTTVIPLCEPGEMENCTTALSKCTAQLSLQATSLRFPSSSGWWPHWATLGNHFDSANSLLLNHVSSIPQSVHSCWAGAIL